MNALHEEWQEYYMDRKAMIVAAGKSIEYVVGPDRNNGAPHGRQVRSYISLGDILDQPRPVAAHGGHAAEKLEVTLYNDYNQTGSIPALFQRNPKLP